MFAFLFKLAIAVALYFFARYLSSVINARTAKPARPEGGEGGEGETPAPRRRSAQFQQEPSPLDRFGTELLALVRRLSRIAAIFVAAWAIFGTSVVWPKSGHFATLNRVYFGSSLPPGRIVALEGELGPQARIITAGFHWETFVTLINEVDEKNTVYTVPPGKCAIMSAKDGHYIVGGSAFAEPWPDMIEHRMANDAVFFLTSSESKGGGGQRGPQATVLTPGSYTLNPYLWETPRIIPATRVEQGTVGVVKSSVLSAVDFGPFTKPKPTNNTLTVLTPDKLPANSAKVLLVPVGAIGVWEVGLPNGLYYINNDAYKMTMVPSTAIVCGYKGGYKYRNIEILLDKDGQITERATDVVVAETKDAADSAIFTKPEGWDVPQELRALVQIDPELAPFVVASLGLTEANATNIVEDRVVTPILRSVVRNVIGGMPISFIQTRAKLDAEGKPMLNAAGESVTESVHEYRPVRVMDLLENRSSIEKAILDLAKPECLKEGVSLMEIRLSDSAIPGELLIARKREQLAQQLTKAWVEEQKAQDQRQKTENARSQADQQVKFVAAEIDARAALERAKGREAEGTAEKNYLISLAQGQEAQQKVLGPDKTAQLQMFGQALKMVADIAKEHPEVLITGIQNASKFVPNVVVNNSGGTSGSGNSGSMEGAAAIFAFMNGGGLVPGQQPPAPKPVVTSTQGK